MARKVYVKVNADFTPEGRLLPRKITWENGCVYEITRILDRARAASEKVGGGGIRYTVVVNGQESFLFKEDDKWFVEGKR